MMIDWNIQARAHTCQTCSRPFADQQPFHTLLFDERQQYLRLDVCAQCWQQQHSEGASDRKGFVSHWQSLYQSPAETPEPIQKETAETLLRKLIETGQPRYNAVMYILAVMLERKRILKIQSQFQQDQQRVFVYEHGKTGEVFTVPDPNLQLNQLEAVQREVAAFLQQGLPALQEEKTPAEPHAVPSA